jgi:hypothetical protein
MIFRHPDRPSCFQQFPRIQSPVSGLTRLRGQGDDVCREKSIDVAGKQRKPNGM